MNDKNMENKAATSAKTKVSGQENKNQPVKVIRHGAVAASIWQRQAQGGFTYFDFTLSRSWKSQNGEKSGYSQNFFDANREAMIRCIDEAAAFIEANGSTDRTDHLVAA